MQPFFTPERLARVMDAAGVDLLLASRKHNTAYLTGRFAHLVWEFPDVAHCLEKDDDGCESPFYFAGVPRDMERGAFVVAHGPRASVWRGKCWIEDVRNCCYRSGGTPPVPALAEVIRDHGFERGRIGIEINHLGAGILMGLQEALPEARFVDATQAIWQLRMVKCDEEIRRLDGAYQIAERIYHELFRTLAESGGMTVAQARGLEMRMATEAGCPPLHFGYVHPQRLGERRPWGGEHAVPIEKGDTLMLDMGLIYKGYSTDFGRVAVWGKADDRLRRAWDSMRETRQFAETAIRPGRRASEVYQELAAHMEGRGLRPQPGFGHGLGIECHEPPILSPEDHTMIEPGMVIVPELGGGVEGVGLLLEDGGIVREDGWHRITRLGTELIEFGV
jgi:Xaa-Pro aminopeptidase/Xaa-Pro dipeptidase